MSCIQYSSGYHLKASIAPLGLALRRLSQYQYLLLYFLLYHREWEYRHVRQLSVCLLSLLVRLMFS